ncbi:MAG: hypothetical protein IKL89_01970, partial [Clostridia bacterium]|nr:hypothetical protein [Clostridia bacterium]
MKKIVAVLLAAAMVLALAACAPVENPSSSVVDDTPKAMTYAEFNAAALEAEVVVETYIQAKQGWWEKDGVGVATFYTQNEEGAYFVYEMPCSKDDYDNKLVKGAKIRVTGYKAAWSGEVEIIDAKYEVLEGNYVATAKDLTDKLGAEDLIDYQNQLALFKGMTVEKIEYKNGQPGDDIYVTLGYNGASYSFCVECYLTGPDTDVYKAVGELKTGDVVDVEGFVYWYEGINTHITAVSA